MITKGELDYWDISELDLEPCCAIKYYQGLDLSSKEIADVENDQTKDQEFLFDLGSNSRDEAGGAKPGKISVGRIRRKIWRVTEFADYTPMSKVSACPFSRFDERNSDFNHFNRL